MHALGDMAKSLNRPAGGRHLSEGGIRKLILRLRKFLAIGLERISVSATFLRNFVSHSP